MLREDDSYMKDFIDDEKGEICAVYYQKVTNQ